MKTSESIIEIAKALCEAQKVMKPAIKDSTNPHFKSKYSDLSSVWESIRNPLTSNGLTIWQDITSEDKCVNVTTRVTHISGQWIEFGPLSIPLLRQDAQAIGSATSYAKRYALCAAIGIVSDEDDDGNKASELEKKSDKPKMTTNSQWVELNQLSEQCDDEYQKNMWDYLASQDILSFEKMDEKTFLKLKKGCLGNIEKQKKIHAIG